MRSIDEIIVKLAAKFELTPEQQKMYNMPPKERTQYKREQAEQAVGNPVEYMKQKFHTNPQYADLGPKWIEGIVKIIFDDPGLFFASKIYLNKTFGNILDKKAQEIENEVARTNKREPKEIEQGRGRDNFIKLAARAIIKSDPLSALNTYKFQNMTLLNKLSLELYTTLKKSNANLNASETKGNFRKLIKVLAQAYPDKFLATEELVNNPNYQALIPMAKRWLAK